MGKSKNKIANWSEYNEALCKRGSATFKEGMVPNKPEQLWVADITYLATQAGNTYLSLITDAYSRKIVGYHLDDNIKTQAVKSAFLKALKKRRY